MNRRNFLNKLGLGAVACAVVPAIIKDNQEPTTGEIYDVEWEEVHNPHHPYIIPKESDIVWRTVEARSGVTFHIRELKSFANPSV